MKKSWKNSKNRKTIFFPMSASQDTSVEYNQLNIKICDFFPLGAFGCFLTNIQYGRTESYGLAVKLESKGPSAIVHENPYYNGKRTQSHGALSRQNNQVGLRKWLNYGQYIQTPNNKPAPKSAQCINSIELLSSHLILLYLPIFQAQPSEFSWSKVAFLLYISCYLCSGIGLLVFTSQKVLDQQQSELWNIIQV